MENIIQAHPIVQAAIKAGRMQGQNRQAIPHVGIKAINWKTYDKNGVKFVRVIEGYNNSPGVTVNEYSLD